MDFKTKGADESILVIENGGENENVSNSFSHFAYLRMSG